MQVNRYLKDKHFDHIDHALGRPVDPRVMTYRNYYAANANGPEAADMAASPHWKDHGVAGGLRMFSVTDNGRDALAEHLREIGDRRRLYVVTFDGFATDVAAESPAKARYAKWLELSDYWPDLTFRQFQSKARVRLARSPAAAFDRGET